MRRTPHLRSGRALAAATTALLSAGIFAAPAAGAAPAPAPGVPHVLFSFAGKPCAGPLFGVIAGAGGVLYGATAFDLGPDGGCVFSLTPGKSGYTQRTLFRFAGLAGRKPDGIVADSRGDLFGNTTIGGTDNQGVVFELVPSASGSYTERILHNFTGGADGSQPAGSPVLDAHGDLFGITQFGGSGSGIGNGTVFSLTPHGSGYAEHVLHAMAANGADGFAMEGQLLLTAQGSLFGTATIGGIKCSGIGCGTLFELTPSGTSFTFRVVHQFTGPPDGADPEWSGLIAGPGGTLIGTTRSGGTARGCSDGGPGGVLGCGTVYQITP